MRSPGALSQSDPGHRLPAALRIFVLCSCAAPLLTLLRALAAHKLGVPREGWNPLADRLFGDLLDNQPAFTLLHRSEFFSGTIFPPVSYPPVGTLILGALYGTGHAVRVYLTIAALWLLAACQLVRNNLLRYGIGVYTSTFVPIILVFVSFPIVGLLQRGNIELFVWILTATGIWAYLRNGNVAAGLLWGLAGSVKLYPLVFLVLLLNRRKFRAMGTGIAAFVLATLGALAYLGPTTRLAAKGALRVVFGYQSIRVSEWSMHELAANHSFFGLVKVAAVLLNRSPDSYVLAYYLVGAALFLWLFYNRLASMPEANQLLGVTAFMLTLPTISYFYTLVHLYASWLVLAFLLIRAQRAQTQIPSLTTTLFLFLPLFVSFTLLTYAKILAFGGLIQAVLLYGLLACATQHPFAEPTSLQRPERPLRGNPQAVSDQLNSTRGGTAG